MNTQSFNATNSYTLHVQTLAKAYEHAWQMHISPRYLLLIVIRATTDPGTGTADESIHTGLMM